MFREDLKLLEEKLIPNLTIKENLSIPLTFMGIDKQIRDDIVNTNLKNFELIKVANKYPRFLTPNELEKVLGLYEEIHARSPYLQTFLKVLQEKAEARSCLPIIQHELFINISNDLKQAVKLIRMKDYDMAAGFLECVIDRLALRMVLSSFYEIPSLRVLDVSLLVIRNYHNLLKYRTEFNEALLKESEKRVIPHLEALAESFSEIAKLTR